MNESPLMSLDDIAALHRCDRERARTVIVRRPGFPREVPTSTRKNRLWLRAEVMAYLMRNYAESTQSDAQPA